MNYGDAVHSLSETNFFFELCSEVYDGVDTPLWWSQELHACMLVSSIRLNSGETPLCTNNTSMTVSFYTPFMMIKIQKNQKCMA